MRAFGEPEPRQFRVDALLRDGTGNSVQSGMEQEISGHCQFEVQRGLLKHDAELAPGRHRMMAHVVAHDLDAAGIGYEQAGEEPEQRGFAGAVRPKSAMNSPADAVRLTPSSARIAP